MICFISLPWLQVLESILSTADNKESLTHVVSVIAQLAILLRNYLYLDEIVTRTYREQLSPQLYTLASITNMTENNFLQCSAQLIEDPNDLLCFYYSFPPTRNELFDFEHLIENVKGAVERIPLCPQFKYMATPGKSHSNVMYHWRKLMDLTSKWELQIGIDRDDWLDEEKIGHEVYEGIRHARPTGMTQRRYTEQEARISN